MKLFMLLVTLGVFALADLINLTPAELQKKIEQNVVVVDIRTPPEWKELGVIPGSKRIMFFDENGRYNVEVWLKELSKYVKSKEQQFVLVCRSGNRTGSVGSFLSKQVGYKNVYHLHHGIKSWIKEKREVVKD